MQKVTSYDMPVAIGVAKSWSTLPREVNVFFYWWVPDTTFLDLDPVEIVFPPYDFRAYTSGDKRTVAASAAISKIVSQDLVTLAPSVEDLARNLRLGRNDVMNMLKDMQDTRDSYATVACHLVKVVETCGRLHVCISFSGCDASPGSTAKVAGCSRTLAGRIGFRTAPSAPPASASTTRRKIPLLPPVQTRLSWSAVLVCPEDIQLDCMTARGLPMCASSVHLEVARHRVQLCSANCASLGSHRISLAVKNVIVAKSVSTRMSQVPAAASLAQVARP